MSEPNDTHTENSPFHLRYAFAHLEIKFNSVASSPDGVQIAAGSSDNTVRVWEAATGKLVRSLEGHQNWVLSVAWSPDGKQIASGSSDNTVRVWEAGSGKLLRTLGGHENRVNSVAWSPDGKQIASGSSDNTIRVWEAHSARLLGTLGGHQYRVNSVTWSPDGKQIASGSDDSTVRIWEAGSGDLVRTLEGHQDSVRGAIWSPDGKQIASASSDNTVRVWETRSGRLLRTLGRHDYRVNSVAWSPDGKQIASGSDDRTVRVWKARSGKLLWTGYGHECPVLSVVWLSDGEQIASGSDDSTVRVWETGGGKLLKTLGGHQYRVNSVAWSPDGTQIASGSHDKTVRVWETATGKLVRALMGHHNWVLSVAWSPDGKQIASGSSDNTVRVWEIGSGKLVRALEGHTSPVNSTVWSPDGRQIASGSDDSTVRVWEARSGKLLRALEGHQNSVWSVAWSPDGKQIASGSDDSTVRVWEAATGKLVRTLEGHQNPVRGVTWSPDGKQIASGSSDKTVRAWEAATGKLVSTMGGHQYRVNSVAWSPDGKHIASGSSDKTVKVWDGGSGKLVTTLEGHQNWVLSGAWSPDGKQIASGSSDKTVRLWEAATGKLVRTVGGHQYRVNSVAWSPDGKQIASGSDDNSVRVWEASSARLVRKLVGHEDPVLGVDWSPDGKQIASGSSDGTVRLWEARGGKFLRALEGHQHGVLSVAWSPDSKQIASGSSDETVRLWEAGSGKVLRTLQGHRNSVLIVAWSRDGKLIVSGSSDETVRVWEADSGKLARVLGGHQYRVSSVAWSPDGKRIASGSSDETVRVWEAASGKLLRILEGPQNAVRRVAWSPDGRQIASASDDYAVRVWEANTGQCLHVYNSPRPSHFLVDLAYRPSGPIAPSFGQTMLGDPDLIAGIVDSRPERSLPAEEMTQIVNAKIVLVGESGVGKSGLALRLAEDRFEDQVSTHGMRLWLLPTKSLGLAAAAPGGERREIVLWDLGGQDDYRLVHQLFLRDTTIALMLLDPTRTSHFDDIDEWNLRLEKRLSGRAAARLLVGAKADLINEALIDKTRISDLIAKWHMKSFCLTSAKENTGIAELRDMISQSINWEDLSPTSRPRLFQRVREAIDDLRRKGEVVILHSALEKQIKASQPGEFSNGAVNTVVEQLARQGAITDTRLSTGDRALILQAGYVETYAASLILIARENSRVRGIPAIELSEAIFRRTFPGINDRERLPVFQERSVIECVVELMIENGICLKHERLLVFPTLFPEAAAEDDQGAKRAVSLFYDFSGAVDNIYSSLVAQLAVGERFGRVRLWKNRAEFDRPGQGVCGLRRIDRPGGRSHLDLLFGEETSKQIRDLFTVFVEDHLVKEGVTIREVLEMDCRKCGYRFDESLVSEYIGAGLAEIPCPRPLCDTVSPISEGAVKARAGSPSVAGEMVALRRRIDTKKRREIDEAKRETKTAKVAAAPVRILHLSDLHLDKGTDPVAILQPLARDLKDHDGGLGFNSLDYLVVSGDLTNRASPEEFELVHEFLSALMGRFDLSAARCVIVPGNHDLSWEVEDTYKWQVERKMDANSLKDGSYVRQGNGYLIRDDGAYPRRFENFNRFYHQLMQQPYPLKPEAQHMAFLFEEHSIQFLAMNSAWEIDEYFPHRSTINQSALAGGLLMASTQIEVARNEGRIERDTPVLRIAVWHHPVTGNEKIRQDAFLDQLRQEGFKLCLNGHVHENQADVIGYLHPRKIHVTGAGSFGAPARQRPESTPRLYNVLEVWRDRSNIRVHTRCMAKDGGAWEGWAGWPGNDPTERRTYYDIRL